MRHKIFASIPLMDRLGTPVGRVQTLIHTEYAAQQTDMEASLSEVASQLKRNAEVEEKLRSLREET